MTAHALDLGLMVALQHLWQGALLLVLVAWSRRGKHSAEAHSWVVLLAFLLAAYGYNPQAGAIRTVKRA